MRMSSVHWMPVIVLGVIGCSESSPEARSESSPEARIDGRVGNLREEIRIDGHAELLVPIAALTVADDGTIALFQQQEHSVRFYSAEGQLRGVFGRLGDGPGDFRFFGHMGWRADTLWVYDVNHRRITYITPDLELARIESNILQRVHGIDPEGNLLLQHGVVEWPQRIVRADAAESREVPVLELPSVPANSGSVQTLAGRVILPFANLPVAGFSSDGSRVAGAMASLDGPDAETFSLTVVDYAGDTIFDRRYRFRPEPVSPSVADSVIDERVGIGERLPEAPVDMRSWAATVRAATRIPPIWPPLVGLMVGNDGTVWVELRQQHDAKSYYVVAADGDPVGTVIAPTGSRFGAASMDWVWSIETDELGVESLVRYSLTWK